MRLLLAVLGSLSALALVPFALDWRSPFLFSIRAWALAGLIILPFTLILVHVWLLIRSSPWQRVLRVFASLGVLAAALALTGTLAHEARFHWVRYRVLHADPAELEKLGRHLIVGYCHLKEIRELVRLRAVAGIFLSARNVRGKSVGEIRQEVSSLQNQRQQQALPRLWIATDQEGGSVSRLSPPLPRQPALSEIVERYSGRGRLRSAVRQYALTQAQGLRELGVNLNFAPVVDLNYRIMNPDDRYTRIYQRAVSHDPEVVAQVAAWYCAALEEAGVRCTLKHFPGLGRVRDDTHLRHANLATSVAELTGSDWIPFLAVMGQSRAFTMLGHVRLTAIDPERPVSFSPKVVAGMIRSEGKHDGVLITDNFSMYAVYGSRAGIENASIQALNAGVDLILISYDPDQYYRVMYALLKAARHGKLDPGALHRSDQRLARARVFL